MGFQVLPTTGSKLKSCLEGCKNIFTQRKINNLKHLDKGKIIYRLSCFGLFGETSKSVTKG